MKTTNAKRLVSERLNAINCGELPAAVREKLEAEFDSAWHDEATRLVEKIVTPKRVATAFAESLGVKRKRSAAILPPPLPRE